MSTVSQRSSTSACVSQPTKNETASVNGKVGPALRPMNRWPSSSHVAPIIVPAGMGEPSG